MTNPDREGTAAAGGPPGSCTGTRAGRYMDTTGSPAHDVDRGGLAMSASGQLGRMALVDNGGGATVIVWLDGVLKRCAGHDEIGVRST